MITARVISLAINVPGPVAAYRLQQLGATVLKVEPPKGDPVATTYPGLYRKLHRHQQVITLDLKMPDGRARLDGLLADTDVLITSMRPRALQRLGLAWEDLHSRFPRICHVAIVGFRAPDEDIGGHDLLYQAVVGLLDPPQMPRALVADYAGAEHTVSAALALLLERAQTGEAGRAVVSLADAADLFADPHRYGATGAGGPLSGALPWYGLYRARDGWLALGALEESFIASLKKAFGVETLDRETLEKTFITRTAEEWETWGREHDIPIAAVGDRNEESGDLAI